MELKRKLLEYTRIYVAGTIANAAGTIANGADTDRVHVSY